MSVWWWLLERNEGRLKSERGWKVVNEPCSSIASGKESSESSSVGYRKVLRSFAEV